VQIACVDKVTWRRERRHLGPSPPRSRERSVCLRRINQALAFGEKPVYAEIGHDRFIMPTAG